MGGKYGSKELVSRSKWVATYEFRIGDRVVPSDEGLKTFRRWAGRKGRIIGNAGDRNLWRVQWDGSVKVELIHVDLIARCASNLLNSHLKS